MKRRMQTPNYLKDEATLKQPKLIGEFGAIAFPSRGNY